MANLFAENVIKACLDSGIDEFVLCGGSRNSRLLEAALSLVPSSCVWNHFEERGAAFFALGRTMVTGKGCAVIVTSGTAVAECLPAVIEAYHQKRPLVILSADRPKRFQGSGAPQVIEQKNLLAEYTTGFDQIEEQAAIPDERKTIFSNWDRDSPWHVNVGIEESPVTNFSFAVRGASKVVGQKEDLDLLAEFLETKSSESLVVMVGGSEKNDQQAALSFLKGLKVPVVADATSGLRESLGDQLLIDADSILRKNPPRKILRIGEVPIGRFWRDLEEIENIDVLSICRNGFPGLARESIVLTGEVPSFLEQTKEANLFSEEAEELLEMGRKRKIQIDELLRKFPESEPGMIRELSNYSVSGDSVFLGNSLPIREWGQFAQLEKPIHTVRACRGANGIDGQVSTWLGTCAEETESWGVFGDLTALYDLTAPSFQPQLCSGRRELVVINNGGGRIFEQLQQTKTLSKLAQIAMIQPHRRSLKGWADIWEMSYLNIQCQSDFTELHYGTGLRLVEIFPNQQQTDNFWKELNCLRMVDESGADALE